MDSFKTLVETINTLRSENGCPWDRKQTLQSLRTYLTEETYELCDAVDRSGEVEIAEELGDVLLNVVLMAVILREQGGADIDSILQNLNGKIIARHPHVFGDRTAADADDAFRRWHGAKKKNEKRSLFSGIPLSSPALVRAHTIVRRSSRIGFFFDDAAGIIGKIEEELAELRRAALSGDRPQISRETGDLFFALVNLCVFYDFSPDDALRATCDRFLKRFEHIEQRLDAAGADYADVEREEVERLWEEAKRLE